eukprot:TRINITY_DN31815_c0_g1_i1.p2 TRINITY_DN31815_c0_g1~~TRINITY_DN31815_c0_g1_i1.p2  ORF type:complete len:124 (+),score=3.38 TRINITY_DN31815_c0_g1_i1:256-627(+)
MRGKIPEKKKSPIVLLLRPAWVISALCKTNVLLLSEGIIHHRSCEGERENKPTSLLQRHKAGGAAFSGLALPTPAEVSGAHRDWHPNGKLPPGGGLVKPIPEASGVFALCHCVSSCVTLQPVL